MLRFDYCRLFKGVGKFYKLFPVIVGGCIIQFTASGQPLLETGGQKMPDEWIDKDTHHKIVRLVRMEGKNTSFYFTNNPFYSNKMVFYNTGKNGRQLYTVDMNTYAVAQLTRQGAAMNGELVGQKTGNVYYQVKDSVFSTNSATGETKLLFVFPADY